MSENYSDENRTLVIRNFRNLGPFCTGEGKENNEDKEFLKINRSLELEDMGGLILLIGVNNSGKTNVLDALEHLLSNSYTEDDYTDFTFTRIEPKISMNIANGEYDDEITSPYIFYVGPWNEVILSLLLEKESFDWFRSLDQNKDTTIEQYLNYVDSLYPKMRNKRNNEDEISFLKMLLSERGDVLKWNVQIDSVGKIGEIIDGQPLDDLSNKLAFEDRGIKICSLARIDTSGSPFRDIYCNDDPDYVFSARA
ncbi:MAG: hypothetical protein E7Z64_03255 [Thermoplasmata archaeon]|nr:hypothetical protein [Thermoplasmata archaeon]